MAGATLRSVLQANVAIERPTLHTASAIAYTTLDKDFVARHGRPPRRQYVSGLLVGINPGESYSLG